jgi:hypothetical protein
MIEAIADLFVERVPIAVSRPALTPATRLLIVDACGSPRRIAELAREVERRAPVTASVVGFDRLADLPAADRHDAIWVFVDETSDRAYCGLVMRELETANGVHAVRVVAIGADADAEVTVDASAVGGSLPWRRRRAAAAGADQLVARLLGPQV